MGVKPKIREQKLRSCIKWCQVALKQKGKNKQV